jgi:hypothetical protein
MTKENLYSPSTIAFAKDIIDSKSGIDFTRLFEECVKKPECFILGSNKKITEEDLIINIVYEGRLLLGVYASFESAIIAGVSTIAKSLGLL